MNTKGSRLYDAYIIVFRSNVCACAYKASMYYMYINNTHCILDKYQCSTYTIKSTFNSYLLFWEFLEIPLLS